MSVLLKFVQIQVLEIDFSFRRSVNSYTRFKFAYFPSTVTTKVFCIKVAFLYFYSGTWP